MLIRRRIQLNGNILIRGCENPKCGNGWMSGSELSSTDLDDRRKRVLFRCWHRGVRELDLILGGFADSKLAAMPEGSLDALEKLLEENDLELLSWIIGQTPLPDEFLENELIEDIQAFHSIKPNIEKQH